MRRLQLILVFSIVILVPFVGYGDDTDEDWRKLAQHLSYTSVVTIDKNRSEWWNISMSDAEFSGDREKQFILYSHISTTCSGVLGCLFNPPKDYWKALGNLHNYYAPREGGSKTFQIKQGVKYAITAWYKEGPYPSPNLQWRQAKINVIESIPAAPGSCPWYPNIDTSIGAVMNFDDGTGNLSRVKLFKGC
jgi:hypothetical protein